MEIDEGSKRNIYVSLDALLDTRFSIVNSFNKGILKNMITDNSYFYRVFDEFEYMNNTIFTNWYKHRNNNALINAPLTKLIYNISEDIINLASKEISMNETPTITVDINMYPYKLNEKDIENLERSILFIMVDDDVILNFINIDPKELTLGNANEEYQIMYMYDGIDWLSYQIANNKGRAMSTLLYTPAILGKALKFKSIKDIEKMFESYEQVFSPYIIYKPISSEYFSARNNYKKEILEQLE